MSGKSSRVWVIIMLIALLLDGVDALAQRGSRGKNRSRVSAKAPKRSSRVRSRVRKRRNRRNNRIAREPSGRTSASSIPPERVTEIQNALIRTAYFSGALTTQYDEATVQAMKRFQTAHRLPATGLPSAQSLRLLGVTKNSHDGYSVPVKSLDGPDPPKGKP